jgi:hypothetical protein
MSSIFLSHNHKDKPFVRRLSDRLQAHGIRTWLDEAEMHVGDSLISKIEVAIQETAYLGVILSPNSVTSEWVRREVNIALTKEIQGKTVKVLPILYQKCEIPWFIADKIYADFTQDFDEGFEKLLARLSADLLEEERKRKRAMDALVTAYQDWISFGKQDNHLLDRDKITLVEQYVELEAVSLEIFEFLLYSVAYSCRGDVSENTPIRNELSKMGRRTLVDLFSKLLNHPTPKVRSGIIKLIEHLSLTEITDLLVKHLTEEQIVDVRHTTVRSIYRLGKDLPVATAQSLFEKTNDWIVRSYALRSLEELKSCLLIPDGTKFASELGEISKQVGFTTISSPTLMFSTELASATAEILGAHKLIILVRGEHYTSLGTEQFYSNLRDFVHQGGSLLATSWVSWENKYNREFANVLPFKHVQDLYKEDVTITCKSTISDLAQQLFPNSIRIRTSYEVLRPREDTVVLLETQDGIPIFGFRRYGAGICYYLNSCQHSCFGRMPSPLETNSDMRHSMQKAFEWIFESLE